MSSQVVTRPIILYVCLSQHTAAPCPPERKHPKQIRLILPWLYLIRTPSLPSCLIRWKLDFLRRLSNQTCVKVKEKLLQRDTRSRGQVQMQSDVSRMFVPSCSWWVPGDQWKCPITRSYAVLWKPGCRTRLRLQLYKIYLNLALFTLFLNSWNI